MATPINYLKVSGKTAGSDLVNKLSVLNNVSIANAFRNIGAWFESIGIGVRSFNGSVMAGGTPASDTVTFSSFVNTNTVTVNGTVLTGATSPSTPVQFQIGATDTITALNFVNLINGSQATNATLITKVTGVVTATQAAAVVTLTWTEPGAIGNLGTLAISANGSVGGANFTGGTDGTVINIAKGI